MAALFVDDLADGLRAAGWEIVPLDEAYADPIAEIEPDTWFLGSGRVAALAQVKGWEPRDLVHERTDEEVLGALFAERVLVSNSPGAHEPPVSRRMSPYVLTPERRGVGPYRSSDRPSIRNDGGRSPFAGSCKNSMWALAQSAYPLGLKCMSR